MNDETSLFLLQLLFNNTIHCVRYCPEGCFKTSADTNISDNMFSFSRHQFIIAVLSQCAIADYFHDDVTCTPTQYHQLIRTPKKGNSGSANQVLSSWIYSSCESARRNRNLPSLLI